MKQYRLKITWSNGDSEYVGETIKMEIFNIDVLLQEQLMTFKDDLICFQNILFFKHNIRKVEYEEYTPPACFDCSKAFFLATTGRIAQVYEIEANDRACAAKDPKHMDKL